MSKHVYKGKARSFGGSFGRRESQARDLVKLYRSTQVFVGPSVEGTDEEYVEIVSGKVSDRKPSFAR